MLREMFGDRQILGKLRENWLTWLIVGFIFGAVMTDLVRVLMQPEMPYRPYIWFGRSTL